LLPVLTMHARWALLPSNPGSIERSKVKRKILAIVAPGFVAMAMMISAAAPAHADSAALSGKPAQAKALGFTCVKNVFIHTGNGDYLDVEGSGGSRTPVITWYYNGASNQRWCLEAASQGGYYLHPNNDIGGLCLDDPFGNTAAGPPIWVYTCNGSLSQRWDVNPYSSSTTIRPMRLTSVGVQDSGKGYQTYFAEGGGSTWYYQN
jgi:hypothetical protein